MDSLRTRMKSHPFAASVGIVLIYLAVTKGIALGFGLLPAGLLTKTLTEIAVMLWTFTLVMFCGYGRIYKQRGLFQTLLVALPHLLFFGLLGALAVLIQVANPDTQWLPLGEILLGVLALFGIGFNEEGLFRGIVVNLLAEKGLNTKRDIYKTVFLSSLLFGSVHMINLFYGVAFANALIQSICAGVIGLLFCLYFLRGGSIWGVILLHALQDFSGLFEYLFVSSSDFASAVNTMGMGSLICSVIFLLIALFLLRDSSCKKIIALHAKQAPAA